MRELSESEVVEVGGGYTAVCWWAGMVGTAAGGMIGGAAGGPVGAGFGALLGGGLVGGGCRLMFAVALQ
jgi:hypothetical protein